MGNLFKACGRVTSQIEICTLPSAQALDYMQTSVSFNLRVCLILKSLGVGITSNLEMGSDRGDRLNTTDGARMFEPRTPFRSKYTRKEY